MKTVRTLSFMIAILAAVAAAGGLFVEGLYRDEAFYTFVWRTNDMVTLFLVFPALLILMKYAKSGAEKGILLWMGLLVYVFYNYAFYLFGAAFNAFFLLYVALMALSLYALAIGLWHLNVEGIASHFGPKAPLKLIAIFLVLVALPLAIVEGGQCIGFIFTGKLPSTPSLIFALDLVFVVPNMVLAAVLLWKRKAWGFVLGVMMLTKAATYGAVLSLSATRLEFSTLPQRDELLPFYLFVLLGSVVACFMLMKHHNQAIS